MKLNDVKLSPIVAADVDEQFFSIEDQSMIFDILRSKMYSNPILAICREITCNARDAHREVGKAEEPIVITLPNDSEPYYKVKDFGPGISPDRMFNIFIKYTASTKRSDNIQTGGFGLGAKTPFSYSDSFTIKTVHDGILYNYACLIDETKVGKLALLSSVSTDESNGTEIIIPVKSNDFRFFSEWTEFATRHWDIKPIVKSAYNASFSWQTSSKLLEGLNWSIRTTTDWNRAVKVIVDGIEYPLELEAMRKFASPQLIESVRGNIFLNFGIGELSLSANREQLYLDKPTQEKIKSRFDSMLEEIKEIITNKIAASTNLWDANVFFTKHIKNTFHYTEFLGDITWNDIPLSHNGYVNITCSTFKFSKTSNRYRRRYSASSTEKVSRSLTTNLFFEDNTVIYINDLDIKEITPKHVKSAFETMPGLKSVYVITPNEKVNLEKLNEDIHLDKMNVQKLSSITKASSRKYTSSSSRMIVFKYDMSSASFKQTSFSSIEEDKKPKVICRLRKDEYNSNTPRQVLINNKIYNNYLFKKLITTFKDCSFYGVDESIAESRIDEDFSEFTDINDFIDENIINSSFDFVETAFAIRQRDHIENKFGSYVKQIIPSITNKNSDFINYFLLQEKIIKMAGSSQDLLSLYESFEGQVPEDEISKFELLHPELNVEMATEKFKEKYPLLSYINSYHLVDAVKHIATYINLMDEV